MGDEMIRVQTYWSETRATEGFTVRLSVTDDWRAGHGIRDGCLRWRVEMETEYGPVSIAGGVMGPFADAKDHVPLATQRALSGFADWLSVDDDMMPCGCPAGMCSCGCACGHDECGAG